MKWLSNITPRILHESVGGIFSFPIFRLILSVKFALENVTRRNSVLSSFIFSLFRIIQVLMSEIQAEMVERVSSGECRSKAQ